jgi:hypothetical protein
MWDASKSKRFQELRRREDAGTLTPAEVAELTGLIQVIDDMEAAYLGPATERLRREHEAIEVQNQALLAFLSRGEAVVTQLESVLAKLEAERQALDEERARVVTEPTGPATTVKH